MSELVNGKDVIVEFYDGGEWKIYLCARSMTLTVDTSYVDVTTKGAGKYRKLKPERNSFSVDIDGVVAFGEGLGISDLRARQLAQSLARIRFVRTGREGSVYTDRVDAFISQSTDTSSFDNIATFGIHMEGTGIVDQEYTPPTNPNGKMYRIDFTMAGGETSLTEPLLVNKDLQFFGKDGAGYGPIITSGSPADKEVLYDSPTGLLSWMQPAEPGEKLFALYQDL